VSLSVRNIRLFVLGLWAAFLAWLWLSGQVLRYLGPRTSWVVTFGALTLVLVTVAYARSSAGAADARRGVSRGEAAGLLAMLTPILLAVMLSGSSLGALAASKKLSARGVDLASLAESLSKGAADIDFLQIKAAGDNPQEGETLGLSPGRQVNLTGFVMKAGDSPKAPFTLGRFYITCCVADAIPIGVTVDPTLAEGGFPANTWLDVTGALDNKSGSYVVDAERIEKVSEPSNPYLAFR
jgi:putative membrane protein